MNVISIELCAEDRARLDRIASTLEAQATLLQFIIDHGVGGSASAPVMPEAHPVSDPFPVADSGAAQVVAPVSEPEPVKRTVKLEQIQKKATQIAAGSAEKKAALRALVNRYAPKVTDLPEHTWTEVWDALCDLESEA